MMMVMKKRTFHLHETTVSQQLDVKIATIILLFSCTTCCKETFHINAKHSHTPNIRHHRPREDLTNACNHTRGNEPGGCMFLL